METPPTTNQAAALSLPGAGVPPALPVGAAAHGYTKGCACQKCEGQRAKWRTKSKAKGNPFAASGAQSSPDSRPALAIVPGVAGDVVAAVPAKPFVPWTVELVRPLLAQAANLVEKWDGASLVEEAGKVSDAVAKFVAGRVAWNAEAKTMLVDGAAECSVKYLNLSGVSAEYLPEIKFGLAALSIVSARQSLVSELRKMAAEARAAKPAAPVTDQAESRAA